MTTLEQITAMLAKHKASPDPHVRMRARATEAYIHNFCEWLDSEIRTAPKGGSMGDIVLAASEVLGLQVILLGALSRPGRHAEAFGYILGVIRQELKAHTEGTPVGWC